ncbi:MAG TPA: hypothetical protein DCO82_00985 [Alphaproteobacteria bacterium]|nr:hypothetical protein [Alphaproteobacteria bacterium]
MPDFTRIHFIYAMITGAPEKDSGGFIPFHQLQHEPLARSRIGRRMAQCFTNGNISFDENMQSPVFQRSRITEDLMVESGPLIKRLRKTRRMRRTVIFARWTCTAGGQQDGGGQQTCSRRAG